MAYNPSFNRDAKGKLNIDAGFLSIKGGTDAYLLEDELNELQWIQNEARAELVRQITKSGCLQTNDLIEIEELGNKNLNSFKLKGFKAVLNGYLSYINNSEHNGNIITLLDPPTLSSTTRNDFIYLEFWFAEVKQNEPIFEYGGINNKSINYNIVDPRLNFETSRRIQLRWAIRCHTNVDTTLYPNGFISNEGVINTSIFGQGNNTNLKKYNFEKSINDDNLYISGDGSEEGKKELESINGFTYAIPLFMINRLNSAGYNSTYNPNGGINYINSSSVSGRPDGKFANIIYLDQITDLRHQSTLGEYQYSKLYITESKFEQYKNTIINSIQADIRKVENNLLLLDNTVKDVAVSLDSKVDAGTLEEYNVNLTNLINNMDVTLNDNINEINSRLTTQFTDMKNEFSNDIQELFDNVNNIITTQIEQLQISLALLKAEFYRQAETTNTNVAKLETNMLNINTITNNLLTTIEDVKNRVTNLETQLQDLGFESTVTDLVAYGIDMRRNSVITSGGVIDPETKIVSSIGTNITVPYTRFDQYICTATITMKSDGKVGDIWYEKADNSYLIKNTGSGGYQLRTFNFPIDNNRVFAGVGVLDGSAGSGVTVNRQLNSTDFICVSPLESYYGENGDVYVELQGNNIQIKNTGKSGNNFEWFIIDSTRLRNVEVIDVDLDSIDSTDEINQSVITGQFGTNFDVILGAIIAPVQPLGGVGELNIIKSFNSFSILFTGKVKAKVRCLVFKEVTITKS